ncbi:Lactamase-B domain-containing protein [Mycena indigotica]|uniref:Lactamase-B domain-containing protein n=1 Tax=Mycena indigotica TaxID=2126181 RepID=A0A8H6WEH1_9AGAR|nr:Lactamase-B domain-containing protein [Mycena indigotica]KAF7315704.1 Lactamase-B domain-containing protein [Mycena indigotica]
MGVFSLSSKNASVVKLNEPSAAATSTPTNTSPKADEKQAETPAKPTTARRLSLRPFSSSSKHKAALTESQEHKEKVDAANALSKRLVKNSNSEKRAKESALIVRTLIVGTADDYGAPKLSKAVARPQLSKVKSELLKPKSANKVIAQLRALPVINEESKAQADAPIHAVCLAHTDAEEQKIHFAKLAEESESKDVQDKPVRKNPLEKLANAFSEMHVVDLVTAPDLGLGQPGDGEGLLAGAVPTAESVLKGFEQITPQLMALGYATGKAIYPDHKGVHPPTDRMSVLTYWWGLEVVLPPPTLEYLSNTQSISGTLVNFLTALSLVNNGVREILPFVRYISQFIDFEFNMIKSQDQGLGVVCASTWIMPAALVPRPWDFPPPDSSSKKDAVNPDPGAIMVMPVIPEGPNGPATVSPLPKSPASPAITQPSRIVPPVVINNTQPVLRPGISLS